MVLKKKTLKLTGQDIVSIDIGQHTTKIVAGKPNRDGINIFQAISVPTPKEGFEKGRITDFALMKKTIGQALDANKIRSRTALCSVESSEIITRELLLPAAGEEQIEKMLEFEIQQYMPIELSEYTVQSKMLEEIVDDGTDKLRMLVTAVPKDLARNYFDLMQSINLQPVVMDIQSNAIDKLLNSGFLFNGDTELMNEVVAVLDIGYTHINIILFENGKYLFNRIINMGARAINQNLANFMDLSYEESEKLKIDIVDLNKDYAFSEDEVDPGGDMAVKMRVLNIARNTIDSWLEEIERIFKYYTSRSAGNSIDSIYLYGGMTQMSGFDRYLQDAFNIKTNSISSMAKLNMNKISGDAPLASYLNALGTMIRK